ncbi:hypothetical protein E4T40_09702 [Aureobasidium subglaciale]|nr:hypothetical protein E4T40_09702 [Aureobasidium subglaciale]
MEGALCGNPAQDIFHFDIGEPPRRVSIHKTLLQRVSRPLSALVFNGMRESQEECVRLDDVDSQTFSRFVEWLNTDTYSAPGAPDSKSVSDRGDECQSDVTSQSALLPTWVVDGDVCPTSEEQMFPHRRVSSRQFDLPGAAIRPIIRQIDQTQSRSPDTNESILHASCFAHAKLYVFADQRQISALQRLTAKRLQETLQTLNQSAEQALLITSLVDYAYENTAGMNMEENPLRRVMVETAAEQLERLIPSPVFLELLEEGGQFVMDLVREMMARALRREQQNAALEDAANHWQVFIANAAY